MLLAKYNKAEKIEVREGGEQRKGAEQSRRTGGEVR